MIPLLHTFLFFGTLLLITASGYVLWRFIFASTRPSLFLETLLFAFALGLTILDFSMIALGEAGIPLGTISTAAVLIGIILAGFLLHRFRYPTQARLDEKHLHAISLFPQERWLFFLLFALTLFLKTLYLSDAIVPTATDLGHHLYWAKAITETHTLPVYQEREVIDEPSHISLSDPTPIADFIIGEHLPMAAVSFLTGANFFSAFPVVLLLVINLLGLLALVVLTYRLVADSNFKKFLRPELAALSALLLFGPLFTLASPQAKFVSGGVIGNMIGNLFIPLILLLFLRAFNEKDHRLLGLGFLFTFTLAYTHHLSTLILLFILLGVLVVLVVSHWGSLMSFGRDFGKTLLRPVPLSVIGFSILFFFGVALPTYISTQAVGTALGTPTKLTRTGLSFGQITATAGEARFALGLVGLLLACFLLRRSAAASLLLAWSGMLFLMTFKPDWLFLDIPSNRIGTYFSFPIGVAGAIGLAWLLTLLHTHARHAQSILLATALLVFVVASGFFDNGQSLLSRPKSTDALETFAASRFLGEHIAPSHIILKDHNYLVADAWMKHFFMRDYFFPLSRGYFSRYETNTRERCTLDMIAIPNTPRAEACFRGTGVNRIVVNPHFDAPQFEKSPTFSRVYASDKIHIYAR